MPASPRTVSDPAPVLRASLLERVPEPGELVLATDERRARGEAGPPAGSDKADEPVGRNRDRRGPRCRPLDGLGRAAVLDELVRRGAEHDLGRQRRLLEPHRDVDRASRRERLPRTPASPATTSPVLIAASDPERDAVVALKVCVQPGDRLAELGRRAHGAQRIVLVLLRDAEDGHRGIADELLHRSSVPLDDRPDGVEVAPHHGAHHLGVESSAQARRVDDVGEEDRDRLAALGLGRRAAATARREVELLVVAQDRLLQPLELGRRIDAELFDERPPCVAGTPRAPRPAAPSDRARASAGRAAALAAGSRRRASRAPPTSCACRPSSSSASTSSSRAAVRSSSSRAISTCTNGSKARSASAGPRQSAERLAQQLRASLRVPALRRLRHEALETMQVDLFGSDVQDVAGVLRAHELATERLAEIRDQVLERADRRLRRASGPELLDQAVGRDHLARMEHQQRQEGALLSAVSARAHVPPPGPRTGRGPGTRSVALVPFYHCQPAASALVLAARESRVRPAAEHGRMQSRAAADLVSEAERYLAAVAVFRAEGCEPRWRLEPSARPLRRRASNSVVRDLLDPDPRRLA